MNTDAIQTAINRMGGARSVRDFIEKVSGEQLTTHAIRLWIKKGVPAKWVLWIEKEAGISRHLLSKTPLPTEMVVTVNDCFNGTNVELKEVNG